MGGVGRVLGVSVCVGSRRGAWFVCRGSFVGETGLRLSE